MNRYIKNKKGSVILIAVFAIALLATLVMGMLQMNTEELQLMHNHICSAQAQATAEAGLNDAFAEIRDDDEWDTGFTGKSFNDASYTVTVTGTLPNLTISSTGTTSSSFVCRIESDITVGTTSPFVIRIDSLRINE